MQHIRRKSVSDPRSWTAVKKFRLERGLNPALCDTGGVNENTEANWGQVILWVRNKSESDE